MKRYGFGVILAIVLGLASIGVANAQGGTVHYVSYGETLYSIASGYGVPIDAIMMANGLVNPNMIYVGEPLRIPGGYDAGGYGPGLANCANPHVVAPGETLSGIAYDYGLPLRAVMMANDLYNQDMVFVGQTLCIPGGGPVNAMQPDGYGPPSAVDGYYHVVANGETLDYICQRYRVADRDVMWANQLPNPNIIIPGQRLLIPGYRPEHHAASVPVAPMPAPAVLPPLAPPPAKAKAETGAPAAPSYEAQPAKPLLPEANQPIEVVVDGGEVWTGEPYPNSPDPNGDTILIVSTQDTDKPTVHLRSGDYEVKGKLGKLPEYGVDQFRFAFRYIPAGSYDVWFEDPAGTPSDKIAVKVEAGKRVEVNFHKGIGFSGPTYASPDGWVLGEWKNPSKPGQNVGGWSNILVHTPSSGLVVKIESEGKGYEAQCFTGTKGPGACDFAGLNAGLYWIWIDGTQLKLKTYMDGAAYAEFEFYRQPHKSSENKIGPVSYDD